MSQFKPIRRFCKYIHAKTLYWDWNPNTETACWSSKEKYNKEHSVFNIETRDHGKELSCRVFEHKTSPGYIQQFFEDGSTISIYPSNVTQWLPNDVAIFDLDEFIKQCVPVHYKELHPATNFLNIQSEQAEWAHKNFGVQPSIYPFLGIVEELGELAHVILKANQGIRNFTDIKEITNAKKDAVGDLTIYLMNYCTEEGWDFYDIVSETWNQVKTRDWKSDPSKGGQ